MASDADAPASIAVIAGPTIPGSAAKSACASNIAPISSPARVAVSSASAASSAAAAVRAAWSRSFSAAGLPAVAPPAAALGLVAGAAGGSHSSRPTPTPSEPGRPMSVAWDIVAVGQSDAAVAARTPSRSADDVAPGSLCPMLRSPR